MSLFGDDYNEMQAQPLLEEQTIESILAGRTPSGRPELDELASFVNEVRSVATAPAPKVGVELAAILAGGLTTDKGDLSATAVSNVTGPAPQAAGLPKRRKSMIETIFASAAGKAAAVLAGLSLATTGAAAADVLPQVAQDRVASAVEVVSPFDLPDSADKRQDGEHRKDGDVADDKPADPSGERNPNAEDNFGADVSNRAQTTEDKGKDFGQSVSNDARERFQPADPGSQRPATTPTASNNPGTSKAPATRPTPSNNPGTSHRESAPSQAPASTPTAEDNPGSGYRR